jgi:hypothetical protein
MHGRDGCGQNPPPRRGAPHQDDSEASQRQPPPRPTTGQPSMAGYSVTTVTCRDGASRHSRARPSPGTPGPAGRQAPSWSAARSRTARAALPGPQCGTAPNVSTPGGLRRRGLRRSAGMLGRCTQPRIAGGQRLGACAEDNGRTAARRQAALQCVYSIAVLSSMRWSAWRGAALPRTLAPPGPSPRPARCACARAPPRRTPPPHSRMLDGDSVAAWRGSAGPASASRSRSPACSRRQLGPACARPTGFQGWGRKLTGRQLSFGGLPPVRVSFPLGMRVCKWARIHTNTHAHTHAHM